MINTTELTTTPESPSLNNSNVKVLTQGEYPRKMVFEKPLSFVEQHEIKEIPHMFEGRVPEWFTNDIAYWWWNMSDDEINETLPDWTRKLTHLELDLGSTRCMMLCRHCFKSQIEQHKKAEESWMPLWKLKELITENFMPLWLKTIKICGPWEPFQNHELLPFLKRAHNEWLWVSIFTKWYEIWNDKVVERIYWRYGIHTSEELAKKLKELDVSILLWLNSFDPQKQKEFVWHWNDPLWEKYIKAQRNAMVQLINAWLNEFIPWQPTRLWISFAPMKPEFLDDAFELYKWARMRNIYPLGCPSNDSGDWKKENERVESQFNNYEDMLVDHYVRTYIYNIEIGIQTLDEFLKEWPSLYPWVHVCKQCRTWFYMQKKEDKSGYRGISCPGHDPSRKDLMIAEDIESIKKEEFAELWRKSWNANRWKYFCVARSWITLSTDFPSKVIEGVKKYFNVK